MMLIKGKKCEYCPCKNVWKVKSDKNYITYECGACYQVWKESRVEAIDDLITAIEKKGIKKHTR